MGWTTDQAAAELGKSRSFIHSLIRRGKLRAEKHGRDWDIDPQSVLEYKQQPRNKGGRPHSKATADSK